MKALFMVMCVMIYAVPVWGQDQSLAGRWHGQEVVLEHNPSQYDFYIAQLYDNGALDVSFYECRNGQARVSDVQGTWEFVDGLFTVIFETRNGVAKDSPFLSQYNMVELTKDNMVYTAQRNNITYQAHRIGDDYKPECMELVM